jgi:general secretion pathway protein G
MKRSGFTMIELIFVIVILGILAAVAIPKLAATRDDAKLASIKTDVGTIASAVPAWYTGQKEASIKNAMAIDTSTWVQNAALSDYTFKDGTNECVQVLIVDQNASTASTTGLTDPTPAGYAYTYEPTLRIIRSSTYASSTICKALWDNKNIVEQNISMAGRKVVI